MPRTSLAKTHPNGPAVKQPVPLHVALLDALPDCALLVERNGTVLHANKTWRDLDRLSAINGGTHVHLGDALSTDAAAALLESNEGGRVRTSWAGAAGEEIVMQWTSRPVHGIAGEDMFLVRGRNISREQLLERYIVSQQCFETAAALSGGLAHDFNNVLAAILGLSEIISLRLDEDHPAQEFTHKIASSIERAKVLVRRFSQSSRKASGQVDDHPSVMMLEELADMVASFLPGSVTLQTSFCPDTPWCRIDRRALEQIVLNCINLFRTRLRETTGAVVMSSRASRHHGRIEIEIRGSGQGLLGTNLSKLFDLNLVPTTTAYESGAGLHVARLLAEENKASLTAVARDPRTISFLLEVPIAPEPEDN